MDQNPQTSVHGTRGLGLLRHFEESDLLKAVPEAQLGETFPGSQGSLQMVGHLGLRTGSLRSEQWARLSDVAELTALPFHPQLHGPERSQSFTKHLHRHGLIWPSQNPIGLGQVAY